MKDKLREILDRIDERPDVGSIHEAKDEAISAILKLVEEEKEALLTTDTAEWKSHAYQKIKSLESQLAELKRESAESLMGTLDIIEHYGSHHHSYCSDYGKSWVMKATENCICSQRKNYIKAKNLLLKLEGKS